MIKKYFELERVNSTKNNFFLFYGLNDGLKNEIIEKDFKKKTNLQLINYDENEVLSNQQNFIDELTNRSFFDNGKIYKIDRTTDKMVSFIEKISEINLEGSIIIINSEILDKKSKLRLLFEKDKRFICVPFYPDDNKQLFSLASNFFKDRKISISSESINLLVERARGDRKNLKSEIEKISMYCLNNKAINFEEIVVLTNLSENYKIFELVDNCLAKNTKKTINMLNENKYGPDDCILITRSLLSKSKRLLKLKNINIEKNNIDEVIATYKPPIFWKEKDIVKKQIKNWQINDVNNLISKIGEVEILIKKNFMNSLNIVSDFIISQSKTSN